MQKTPRFLKQRALSLFHLEMSTFPKDIFLFSTEVRLAYNIIVLSGIQHRDSIFVGVGKSLPQ